MIDNAHQARPGPTLLECLRRRWSTALLTAIFAFCASMYVILNLKPLYAAKTTLVLPYTPVSELVNRNEIVGSPQTDPLIIHSYIQILKDDGICLHVIRQLRLVDRPEFNAPPNPLSRFLADLRAKLFNKDAAADTASVREDRILRLYKKRLTVDGGRSLAVDLSFDAENPELAAAIVNAHAEAYQAGQIQYRRHETEVKTAWMQDQVQKSANDLRAAQVAVQLHQSSYRFSSALAANDSAELKYLQSILTSKQSVYESLLNRQQVMLAEQHYGGSDTRILSPARASTRPAFPNTPMFALVAVFAAVLVGAGVAWGSELLAQRRRSAGERLHELGLDQLATVEIPRHWPPLPRRLRKLRLAVFWEKIREVRSTLPPWQAKGLVLAVTAAAPKQATSLVAASLARAFAASGTPTLLLDLNLRDPRAHTYFGPASENRGGLQDCLKGDLKTGRAIRPIGSCLSLLSASTRGGENVDMLAGPVARSMLDELRREYSAIIIDTPSIGVVCDSLVIADLADEVVLVADSETLELAALKQAVWSLRRRSAKIRGVVLTSHRQVSLQACRAVGRLATNDKLSEEHPLPYVGKRARGAEPVLNPGLLQAAE